jgi:hypothetical protein
MVGEYTHPTKTSSHFFRGRLWLFRANFSLAPDFDKLSRVVLRGEGWGEGTNASTVARASRP